VGEASTGGDEQVRRDLAGRVGRAAADRGLTVAVAESLTGGMIAQALAAAEGAGQWFRGSLVCYAAEVKRDVLGVPPGPVVSAAAATAMARGVRRLLGADVAVAVTGAGGPQPQDGREPGTVFLAVHDGDDRVLRLELDGEPEQVCAATTERALRALLDTVAAS
jgi:nicotinamide-nucleotide amidase